MFKFCVKVIFFTFFCSVCLFWPVVEFLFLLLPIDRNFIDLKLVASKFESARCNRGFCQRTK